MKATLAEILENQNIGGTLFWLTVKEPRGAREALPGQFAHILCGEPFSQKDGPGWRRAFSISQVDREKGTLSFLYRPEGRGSRWLSRRKPGETLDLLAPLGKPFPLDLPPQHRPVMVAGGTGLAPFIFLSRELSLKGETPLLFIGMASHKELAVMGLALEAGAQVMVATDDGSQGYYGTVVDLARETLLREEKGDGRTPFLYACGPTAMMAAMASFAREKGWPLYVSLETNMACGTGLCLTCTVPGPRGPHFYRRACVEGPVFPAEEVDWDEL